MKTANVESATTTKTGASGAGSALILQEQAEAGKKIAVANAVATAVTSASVCAAQIVHGYSPGNALDFKACVDVLADHQTEAKAGDLSRAESMLLGQAEALQAMFVHLAVRAKVQTGLPELQILTGLALKAQSGCRATLQALGELKFPRQATFVRQANFAHGHQQVINGRTPAGTHSPAAKTESSQNELLGDARHDSTQLDTRTAPAATRSHPAVATVATVHRAEKLQRKAKGST